MKRNYGLESEKVVSDKKTHAPHKITGAFFSALEKRAQERGEKPHLHLSDTQPDVVIGVQSEDLGEQGLDNGFNLQETALPHQTDLKTLAQLAQLDLQTVQQAIASQGGTLINMSIHPLAKTHKKAYKDFVAPKSIYAYLWHRGWDHAAGIDAKAQNSPTTSVAVDEAADAASVIIGSGAAFIGLFANSPFAEGKKTGFKESRLTMWDRMMKNATVPGDRVTAKFPKKRFRTLAEYFQWMFGHPTGIHFVIDTGHYKTLGDVLLIENNPSVLQYLSEKSWPAYHLKDVIAQKTDKPVMVKPHISHMEAMQFAQFSGARIRYALHHDNFPIKEFVEACNKPNEKEVENIFKKFAKFVYIEGRDTGSNLPDKETKTAGVADFVIMAPAALQAGLIRNLAEASAYIDSYRWEQLEILREAAIKDGLQGKVGDISVWQFAKDIMELAAKGLSKEEQQFLKYPQWVLDTKKNGADRALEFVKNYKGKDALAALVKAREVILQ